MLARLPWSRGGRSPAQASPAERRAAFEAIIQENQAALLRVGRRLCYGREDEAQDLVQEALVRGYEAFIGGRLRPDSNARAWLLRILTNLFINRYRRRQHWEADADDAMLEEVVAGGDGPEESLMSSVMDEQLERALATLSPPLRACVALVDMEGLEYGEAAEALGVPIGTVRSRLSRARYQLHSALHGYAQNKRWI